MRLLLAAGVCALLLAQGCAPTSPNSSEPPISESQPTADHADGPQGALFIIGGGARPDSLMQRFLDAADPGRAPYIAVLTMSSSERDTAYSYSATQFERLGGHPIHFNLTLADVVNKPALDSLKNAAAIYMTGGDQSRFMEVVRDNPIAEAIHHAYQHGAVVGGTSAGAAVMSEIMITGDQRFSEAYQRTYDKVWKDNGIYASGLGMLDWAVVDQHFVARSRYNRLFSALADHPGKWGVGIDEATALLVRGGRAEVCGESQVVVLRPPTSTQQQFRNIGLSGVQTDLLLAGQSFTIPAP